MSKRTMFDAYRVPADLVTEIERLRGAAATTEDEVVRSVLIGAYMALEADIRRLPIVKGRLLTAEKTARLAFRRAREDDSSFTLLNPEE